MSHLLLPSETIQFKNSRGVIQRLSPHAFEKQFGVCYTGRLIVDKSCPLAKVSKKDISLRKVPNDSRRTSLAEQFVRINDFGAEHGGAMKRWLYADQLRHAQIANIYISKIDERVGYGAFAGEDLYPGQMLGEYTGLARAWKKSDGSNAYVFNYVLNAVIDASKRGNFSRFINHSEHGANARYMRIVLDGMEHVILLAKKQIAQNEQILFNYGEGYWRNRHLPLDLVCE